MVCSGSADRTLARPAPHQVVESKTVAKVWDPVAVGACAVGLRRDHCMHRHRGSRVGQRVADSCGGCHSERRNRRDGTRRGDHTRLGTFG